MRFRRLAVACLPVAIAVAAVGCGSDTPSDSPSGTVEHDMSKMPPGQTMPGQHDMSNMKPGDTMPGSSGGGY